MSVGSVFQQLGQVNPDKALTAGIAVTGAYAGGAAVASVAVPLGVTALVLSTRGDGKGFIKGAPTLIGTAVIGSIALGAVVGAVLPSLLCKATEVALKSLK